MPAINHLLVRSHFAKKRSLYVQRSQKRKAYIRHMCQKHRIYGDPSASMIHDIIYHWVQRTPEWYKNRYTVYEAEYSPTSPSRPPVGEEVEQNSDGEEDLPLFSSEDEQSSDDEEEDGSIGPIFARFKDPEKANTDRAKSRSSFQKAPTPRKYVKPEPVKEIDAELFYSDDDDEDTHQPKLCRRSKRSKSKSVCRHCFK